MNNMVRLSAILFAFLFVVIGAKADTAKTLRLATTDWCPYACAEGRPGIVAEYISYILDQHGIKLEIQSYPWSRAIAQAHEGSEADGLLTAVPAEAPALQFTEIPTMAYQVCFYTTIANQWLYETPDSLYHYKGLLGYIAEYSYGDEVDTYINGQYATNRILQLTGNDALLRLLRLLERGRISIAVEDRNIVTWTLLNHPLDILEEHNIRIAGCLPKQPFYVALNTKKPEHKEIIKLLNNALNDPKFQAKRLEIEKSYLLK